MNEADKKTMQAEIKRMYGESSRYLSKDRFIDLIVELYDEKNEEDITNDKCGKDFRNFAKESLKSFIAETLVNEV